MRFVKKRALVAIICILVSGVLSWKLLEAAENTKDTVRVVRAAAVIDKGAMITADMLKVEEVGAFGLKDDALNEVSKIVGMYATADIFPGDNLTLNKFTHLDEASDGFLIKAQEAGKAAVSVGVKSISSALAGKLRVGDVVSVFAFLNETSPDNRRGYVEEYFELKYVEIGAISNNKAEDIAYQEGKGAEGAPAGGARQAIDGAIPASVTFIVDDVQARQLVEAENTGNIHLVFRGRGEHAKELLLQQEELLEERARKALEMEELLKLEELNMEWELMADWAGAEFEGIYGEDDTGWIYGQEEPGNMAGYRMNGLGTAEIGGQYQQGALEPGNSEVVRNASDSDAPGEGAGNSMGAGNNMDAGNSIGADNSIGAGNSIGADNSMDAGNNVGAGDSADAGNSAGVGNSRDAGDSAGAGDSVEARNSMGAGNNMEAGNSVETGKAADGTAQAAVAAVLPAKNKAASKQGVTEDDFDLG